MTQAPSILQDCIKVVIPYTIITILGIVAFYHVANGGFTSDASYYCEGEGQIKQCVQLDNFKG